MKIWHYWCGCDPAETDSFFPTKRMALHARQSHREAHRVIRAKALRDYGEVETGAFKPDDTLESLDLGAPTRSNIAMALKFWPMR